mmetsp:Transcript_21159/g.53600  ORF Transcript_21159/g.53600 Transcript_21159/m.53600 type:complete len:246 (-) Transcript_21159:130-867(-)
MVPSDRPCVSITEMPFIFCSLPAHSSTTIGAPLSDRIPPTRLSGGIESATSTLVIAPWLKPPSTTREVGQSLAERHTSATSFVKRARHSGSPGGTSRISLAMATSPALIAPIQRITSIVHQAATNMEPTGACGNTHSVWLPVAESRSSIGGIDAKSLALAPSPCSKMTISPGMASPASTALVDISVQSYPKKVRFSFSTAPPRAGVPGEETTGVPEVWRAAASLARSRRSEISKQSANPSPALAM